MRYLLAVLALCLGCSGPGAVASVASSDVATVHSGDLVLRVLGVATSSTGTKWLMLSYGTYVHDADEAPAAGVVVRYRVNGRESVPCVSAANGGCGMASAIRIKGNVPKSVTVEVVAMDADGASYDPSANHDLSGDSNGTTITASVP